MGGPQDRRDARRALDRPRTLAHRGVLLAFLALAIAAWSPGVAAAALSWSGPLALDTAPGPGYLAGVACPSASQCTAIDATGREVTFDPTSSAIPDPVAIDPPASPTAVACPSVTQCTLVDRFGQEVTFDPSDPGSPTAAAIGVGATFDAPSIACPAVSQCTVVGSTNAVTFDPASPGIPTVTTLEAGYDLDFVACPSVDQCTAVDNGNEEITFDPVAPGSPTPVMIDYAGIDGLACPSVGQCTVVGPGHEVTFDPTAPKRRDAGAGADADRCRRRLGQRSARRGLPFRRPVHRARG